MTTLASRLRRLRQRATAPRLRGDEAGFSLIEMVIALSLVSGVMLIGTTLLIAALRGNDQVNTTSQATTQAQGVAQGIERAVRNARRIEIVDDTLTVWTTLAGDQTCQKWSGAGTAVTVAQGATSPGMLSKYGAGNDGAALSFPSTETDSDDKVIGVTYAVTVDSETRPVKVTGTVRSRTPHDSTTAAASACGLAP